MMHFIDQHLESFGRGIDWVYESKTRVAVTIVTGAALVIATSFLFAQVMQLSS